MKLHLPKILLTAVLTACVATQVASAVEYTCTGNNDSMIHSLTSEDTLIFDKTNGHLTSSGGAINAKVTINSLTLTDGYSNTTYTFNNSIDGAGEFSFKPTTTATGQHYVFKGSMASYTGNMAFTDNNGCSFTFEGITSGTGTITAKGTNSVQVFDSSMMNSGIEAGTLKIKGTSSFSGAVTATNTTLLENTSVTLSGITTLGTVTGSGTVSLSGTGSSLQGTTFSSGTTLALTNGNAVDTVTMSSGSVLDLSNITLSDSTPAIDTSKLTIQSGGYVNLSNITAGSTIALFSSSVEGVIFTIGGTQLSDARSQFTENNGVYTFTTVGFVYTDLVWSGGNGEWNKSNQNWHSASADANVAFANDDTVTFDSTANVDITEGVSVAGMTVSGADTILTLTRSNGGYIAGTVTVTGGAKMIIGTQTDAQGFVRGEINVTDGTLQYDAKDTTGYSGGATSTQKITIAAGSELLLNHTANETFAGTLVLNGTMKGIAADGAARWDLFGNNATIQVEAGNHATLENVTLQLRQNNSQISIAGNASLTIETLNKGDVGNGILNKAGAGSFIVNGSIGINGINVNGGSVVLNGGGSTGNIDISAAGGSITFGATDSATAEAPTTYTVGNIGTATSGNYTRNIVVAANATVNATNINNRWGMGALTVNGVLNVSNTLRFSTGSNTMGENNIINGSGSITTQNLEFSNVGNYTIDGVTLNVTNASSITRATEVKSGTVNFGALTLSDDTSSLKIINGTVSMTSTNAANRTITFQGGIINIEAGKHTISTLDASNGDRSTAAINLKNGAELTATTIWGCAGSSINLEKGAALTRGIISITGITEDANATIKASSNTSYDVNNANFTISGAAVSVKSDSAVVIGNAITKGTFTNNGTGDVKLTNGYNNLKEIHAASGNINIQWVDPRFQGEIEKLSIADGLIVGFHAGTENHEITNTANEATLTVTKVATFGEGASLYGNLNLKSGVTLSMGGALSMGSDLTLATNLTLNGELMNRLNSLELGSTLILFSGVDNLTLDTTVYTTLTEANGYDMSDIFSNVASDKYYLGYNENGDVYAGVIAPVTPIDPTVPEPTTATLSLLALAALAARRRRK